MRFRSRSDIASRLAIYLVWFPWRVRYRQLGALWGHGWRIFLVADGHRVTKSRRTAVGRTGIVPPRGHSHVWRSWTQWSYSGGGQDSRERNCMDQAACGATETQYRRHQHDSGTTSTVKGVKVRTCNACGATL